MSAGGVRAGSAYVEIFAKDTKFQQTIDKLKAKMASMGTSMRQFGTQMAMGGAMLGAPMVLAIRQFTEFDEVLRATQASAALTTTDLKKVSDAALGLSEELGVDPAKIATGFMELLKAGMSIEDVLGGAGKAAVMFAKVGGLEVADAAVVMKDSMEQFGASAERTANTLSAAADASSTDIHGMTLAFQQASAMAGQANQSIEDTSAALAILANNGIKGSDAGTSLKTMLLRLMAPADDAVGALRELGLSTNSFRDAGGKMRPMVEIIGTLTGALEGMDQAARDDIFRRIFGQDAIRAASVLTKAGVAGFGSMRESMDQALPVGQKFLILMDGVAGAAEKVMASIKRMSITFGEGLAPSLKVVAGAITIVTGVFRSLLEKFPIVGQVAAGVAGGLFTLGVAGIVGGIGLQVMSKGLGLLQAGLRIIPTLFTPVGAALVGVAGGVTLGIIAARELSPAFKRETDAIWAALQRLDFKSAWDVMSVNFSLGLTQMRQNADLNLRQIRGFFAATGSYIADKLIEGMDRFMGLFGADIITLQNAWERLGIYFRAAWDWDYAINGMNKALAEADKKAEEARGRAPTADARAADRTAGREGAASDRQADMDRAREGWDGTKQELFDERARAHDRAYGRDTAKKADEEKVPTIEEVIKQATAAIGGAAGAAGGAAGVGASGNLGRSLGTFGSAAALAIGPELRNLQDPTEATARNTREIAEKLDARREEGVLAGGAGNASGVGGSPAVKAAGIEAGRAMDGLKQAEATRSMADRMQTAFQGLLKAVTHHATLTSVGNQTLIKIEEKISDMGGAFV